MKKFLLIAIAACALLSCTKSMDDVQKPITFTAEIAGDDTKTTVSTDGKVAWVVGDEITISDGTNKGIYYIAEDGHIDAHRFATFTYKSGTKFETSGTYTATYGNVNDQWYVAEKPGSNCPMSAESVSATSGSACKFEFKNSCGVVAVTANTEDIAIAKIMLGNTALNFATAKKLNGTYLVAVPADVPFTSVTFVKADGAKAENSGSSTSVARNQLRALDTKSYFSDASKYSGFDYLLVSGRFTINDNGDQVQFTKGNIWLKKTAGNYTIDGVEANQYDFRTIPSKDACINGTCKTNTTPSGQYGLVSFSEFKDLIPSGYRLTRGYSASAEQKDLNYIIYSRTNCSKIGSTDNARFALVKVGSVCGILLFPDKIQWPITTVPSKINEGLGGWGYATVISISDFNTLESNGVVFLPYAGYTSGGTLYAPNDRAYYLQSASTDIFRGSYSQTEPAWNASANYGSAMRLIKDIVE